MKKSLLVLTIAFMAMSFTGKTSEKINHSPALKEYRIIYSWDVYGAEFRDGCTHTYCDHFTMNNNTLTSYRTYGAVYCYGGGPQ